MVMQYIPDSTMMTAAITTTTETTLLSSMDNLRQYVPLVVSVFVILDILLGSPMANSVLNQIRPPDGTNKEVSDKITSNNNNNIPVSKERIDSQKVAQDAIQRARYTMELRAYLDAQRDPVIELHRQMDQQAALLEQNQNNLQAALRQQSPPNSNDNDNTNKLQK